jgi:hypothetical protein
MEIENFEHLKKIEIDLEAHSHPENQINYIFFENEIEYEFKDLEFKIGNLLWELFPKKILRCKALINLKSESFMY